VKTIKSIDNFELLNSKIVIPSLYLALAFALLINPFSNNVTVNKFDRIIGNALVNNIDIGKVLNNIYFLTCVLVPIIFIILFCIYSKLYLKIEDLLRNDIVELLNNISLVGFVPLTFSYLGRFTNNYSLTLEILIPTILIVSITINILFSRKLNFYILKWCMISVVPVIVFFIVVLNHYGIAITQKRIAFLYFITLWSIYFFISLIKTSINMDILQKYYIVIMLSPLFMSVGAEGVNIANQFRVKPLSKFTVSIIIYGASFLVFILFYMYNRKRVIVYRKNTAYYVVTLIALSFIATQMPYQMLATTDFFEQSNHGSAIYSFLKEFKIPIIENFDAHMLSQSIGGILYGLFNHDSVGAMFVGYSLTPFFVVIFFFLFRLFFKSDSAFLLMLFFPVSLESTYSLYAFGVLAILVTINLYKNKNYMSYIIFWIGLAFTCLYRLDIGMAYGVGAVITYITMNILNRDKDKKEIRKFIYSFIGVTSIFILIYLVICFVKSINPISRLLEFINISNSNVNWSYSIWGDTNYIAYSVSYIILPIIVVLILLYAVYKKIRIHNIVTDNQFISILVLGIGFILNFARGIVRHSLNESILIFIISSAILFISLFFYCYISKKKFYSFLLCEMCLLIFSSLLLKPYVMQTPTLVNSATNNLINSNHYYANSDTGERVVISDSMKKIYTPLKEIFDELLTNEETYLDFTNQTLLYPLLDREKPVYVNQSPGLLSGEYSQKKFIEEIRESKSNVTFVLMPVTDFGLSDQLDGIPNSYRYYLVAEYIGNNYTPLFTSGDFAIWCKNNVYQDKKEDLEKIIKGNEESIHVVDLNNVNFLYGNDAVNLVNSNNTLVLEANNSDPQLMGIESENGIKELLKNNNKITISIDYQSSLEGNCQLFYTTELDEGFSEEKSIVIKNVKDGVLEYTFPCTKYTKIRFDNPDNSRFTINSIKAKSGYFSNINLINYNYLPIEKHSYNLVNLPYLWANYDKTNYNDKKIEMVLSQNISLDAYNSQVFSIDTQKLNKTKGNYLLLKLNSAQQGNFQLTLGNNNNQFNPISNFSFNIVSTEVSSIYILRISSDFMWYSNEISSIRIYSDIDVKLEGMYLLIGDTLN
jgi:hypothetical protein